MPSVRFVERFDLTTPRFALAIIDLAQIQNRTLHHTTTRTASAFDNAPVPVLLAVLPSPCESQVHGPRFYAQTKSRKEGRSSLHAFPPHRPLKRFSFRRQNSKIGAPVGKVGLARDPDYKGKALQLDFTVEDEGVFTTPWSARVTYQRPLGDWAEFVCCENMRATYVPKDSAVARADKPDF